MPPSLPPLVEACADGETSVAVALASGAGRLELCEQLDVGGVTPTARLLDWTLSRTTLPVWVMIRARGGPYTHDTDELRTMSRAARALVARGAQGIVAGVLTPSGDIAMDAMRQLREAAGAPVTFHRAFDACSNRERAVESLLELGIARLLTSGGAATAWEGRVALAGLVRRAADRLVVMPGGSIQPAEAVALALATGARELHVRAERAAAVVQALATAGPSPGG